MKKVLKSPDSGFLEKRGDPADTTLCCSNCVNDEISVATTKLIVVLSSSLKIVTKSQTWRI